MSQNPWRFKLLLMVHSVLLYSDTFNKFLTSYKLFMCCDFTKVTVIGSKARHSSTKHHTDYSLCRNRKYQLFKKNFL